MNGYKTGAQTGACACGAVIFRATALKRYGVCHCRTCRRWTGGPWMAVNAGTTPIIAGQVNVWDSSDVAERGSCKACGSAVFFHRKDTGVFYLALGLFDDQDGWERASEIFVDEQPDSYALVDGKAGGGVSRLLTRPDGRGVYQGRAPMKARATEGEM